MTDHAGLTDRASLTVRAAGSTDCGRRREHNEDVLLIREDLELFAVFDGAGGHNSGDVAAKLGARSVENYFGAKTAQDPTHNELDAFGVARRARYLSAAIHKANRDILEIARSHVRHKSMGTTVVAAAPSTEKGLLHVAHVGDSRCYRLRHGQFELITADHSLLNDVLERRPDLSDEVLAQLPQNVVTRALGMDDNLRVSIGSYPLLGGDRYLLCSDGLSSVVPHAQLALTLAEGEPADVTAHLLIAQANNAGSPDNIAAIVIDCAGPEELRALPASGAAFYPVEERTDPELLILGIEELKSEELLQGGSDELLKVFKELIDAQKSS